jgi:hypothetical protein
MLPGDEMSILRAVYGLKANAEFVEIPSQPTKESRGGKGIVWAIRAAGCRDMLLVELAQTEVAIDGIKQGVGDTVFLSDAK